MSSSIRRRTSMALFAVFLASLAFVAATPTAGAATTVIGGTLGDGTRWRVAKPDNFNGTLVLDLDGYGNAAPTNPGALQRWMNDHGYAIGGIEREPIGYNFAGAVTHFLTVRDAFIAQFGPVARTLTIGNSRGGFASRIAMELHPEIFKGAMVSSGGGAGEIATFNQRTSGLFVLKTLVNPAAPIPVGLVVNSAAENTAIGQLATLAMSTPLGKARMALAGAIEQSPIWFQGATAPTDANAWVAAIGQQFAFANPAQVRGGIQAAAGGQTFWNHGMDYAQLFEKATPVIKQWVLDLYAAAGVDIQTDFATLAGARRIAADPAAVAKAEPMMTYDGSRLQGPVIMVDNMGDPIDSPAYKNAYELMLAKAGKSHLVRAAYINSTGHGGQSVGEKIAGFVKLVERLDTGSWSATDPASMNALAAQLQAEAQAASPSYSLGVAAAGARFYSPLPWDPMFKWDGEDWGTYQRPVPSIAKTVTPAPNAAGWNTASTTVGLTATEDITNFVLSLKYSAAGAGAFAETTGGATASIPVTAEGVTTLTYSASDDEGGASSPQTLTIRIDRTAPALSVPTAVTANATSPSGGAATYAVSATDAGSGAGTPSCSRASGSQFPIGQTTVTCSVSDAAGNSATASFVVTVKGAAAQIADQIALVDGSFASQLSSVQASLDRGNKTPACNQLNAYTNHVRAQSGKQLTTLEAGVLLENAARIAAVIGC